MQGEFKEFSKADVQKMRENIEELFSMQGLNKTMKHPPISLEEAFEEPKRACNSVADRVKFRLEEAHRQYNHHLVELDRQAGLIAELEHLLSGTPSTETLERLRKDLLPLMSGGIPGQKTADLLSKMRTGQ